MLAARETTSVKLDKQTKDEAKKVFKQLGISMGDAINMFLSQVTLTKSIPFEVKIPNDETLQAMKEIEDKQSEKISFEDLENEAKRCLN